MAWGDAYIKDFLEYCLPAILAPGNLSALVPHFSCEVVLVTESKYFKRVRGHASYQATVDICPVRLVPLDDLVVSRDHYGMSITYALYRGFEDLGPRMTECVMVFMCADFIVAQDSLASLVPRLLRGERLILAPSYCTIAENVKPVLREMRETEPLTLPVEKRSMAGLILTNRHYTIRAKTVNQRFFHLPYMEQFYWAVNESVLLGHQLPIAVVAMKPERYVAEPNSYWDYGLIAEFCPSINFTVMADSDEFLMLELREADTAKNELRLGWMKPADIAKRTAGIITEYTKAVGRAQLTLHSGDLPADIDEHRRRLTAFVDEVYALLPTKLHSHLGHPQWTYHYPRFHAARKSVLPRALDRDASASAGDEKSASVAVDLELLAQIDGLLSYLVERTRGRNDALINHLIRVAQDMRGRVEHTHALEKADLVKVRAPVEAGGDGTSVERLYKAKPETAGIAARISRKMFGAAPHYRPWHFMHSRTRLPVALAERQLTPDRKVLLLSSERGTGIVSALTDRLPHLVSAAVEVVDEPEILYTRIGKEPRFDFCLVESNFAQFGKLRRIFETVRPLMHRHSRILAVFFNNSGRQMGEDPDLIRNSFPACGPARIAYTGCWASVAAVKLQTGFITSLKGLVGFSPAYALGMLAAAPLAYASSLLEENRTMENSPHPGKRVTGVTVEIEIG